MTKPPRESIFVIGLALSNPPKVEKYQLLSKGSNLTPIDVLQKHHIIDLIDLISSSLSSYHEKATEALCVGRIQTRLGVTFVSKFSG